MTVTYFSKTSAVGPSSRYRIFQFLPFLQAQGFECRVNALFDDRYFSLLRIGSPPVQALLKIPYVVMQFCRRAWSLLTVGRPDLIVIEGQLFPYLPSIAEWMLSRCRRRIVVEMDDAIYLTRGHARKVPAVLSASLGAIVGNEQLAAFARRFCKRVAVVPTVVDTNRFRPSRTWKADQSLDTPERLTIVWIGLAYNVHYVATVASALRRLQATHAVKLRVVSSQPLKLSGVEVEFHPWSYETEVALLQTSHIGIMPLDDTEWARGKCGLKLLQYMAVGLPSVASPVGVNRDIIAHGENGLLASTEEEWYACLAQLCMHRDLRRTMGQAARHTVEERYSLTVWAPKLADIYRSFASERLEALTEQSTPSRLPGVGPSAGLR